MSMPPPADAEPARPALVLELAEPSRTIKRLVERPGPRRLSISPAQIVIEHPAVLHSPLAFPPGAVALAALDFGPGEIHGAAGRFPILHRLSATSVIPREEGIDGWLWTSTGGSAFTLISEDGTVPNVALVFLKPLEADVVSQVFLPEVVEELRKRSPMGSPTVFGVLLRVERAESARTAFNRLGLLRPLTDREVPPTQRRHLPTDKPANPSLGDGAERARTSGSIPPPGMG